MAFSGIGLGSELTSGYSKVTRTRRLSCPSSWEEGKDKCYKVIEEDLNLRDAINSCNQLGGVLLTPSDDADISALHLLAKQKWRLKWEEKRIWIGLRLKDPTQKRFPPLLSTVGVGQAPPYWSIADTPAPGKIYSTRAVNTIRSGQTRKPSKYIFMRGGEWFLTKRMKIFLAVAVCQMTKPDNEFIRDQAVCGQRPALQGSGCPKEQKIIRGRRAMVGEVPYHIRLRYFRPMKFHFGMTDHQCGGTLIS